MSVVCIYYLTSGENLDFTYEVSSMPLFLLLKRSVNFQSSADQVFDEERFCWLANYSWFDRIHSYLVQFCPYVMKLICSCWIYTCYPYKSPKCWSTQSDTKIDVSIEKPCSRNLINAWTDLVCKRVEAYHAKGCFWTIGIDFRSWWAEVLRDSWPQSIQGKVRFGHCWRRVGWEFWNSWRLVLKESSVDGRTVPW